MDRVRVRSGQVRWFAQGLALAALCVGPGLSSAGIILTPHFGYTMRPGGTAPGQTGSSGNSIGGDWQSQPSSPSHWQNDPFPQGNSQTPPDPGLGHGNTGPSDGKNGPPGNHDGPPGNHDGPPGSYDGPPGNYDGPPANYDEPPGRDSSGAGDPVSVPEPGTFALLFAGFAGLFGVRLLRRRSWRA